MSFFDIKIRHKYFNILSKAGDYKQFNCVNQNRIDSKFLDVSVKSYDLVYYATRSNKTYLQKRIELLN